MLGHRPNSHIPINIVEYIAKKCKAKFRYHLVVDPLFWECHHPRAFTLHFCHFKNHKSLDFLSYNVMGSCSISEQMTFNISLLYIETQKPTLRPETLKL